jgi:hypothetical protein
MNGNQVLGLTAEYVRCEFEEETVVNRLLKPESAPLGLSL